MKRFKWITLTTVLILALGLTTGCEEDEGGGGVSPEPTEDVTLDEMSELELRDATDNGTNAAARISMSTASSMKNIFRGGDIILPQSVPSDPDGNNNQNIAIEDDNWIGPDSSGWYRHTNPLFVDEWRIRFTPDIFADTTNPVERIEMYVRMDTTDGFFSTNFENSMWAEVNDDRTSFDGERSMTMMATVEDTTGQDLSFDYSWNMAWSDVSMTEGDFSGLYTSDIQMPVISLMSGERVPIAHITSDVLLASDGTGNGTGYISNEEYVRYTFEGVDQSGQLNGYYTLVYDDWNQQYPFSFQVTSNTGG